MAGQVVRFVDGRLVQAVGANPEIPHATTVSTHPLGLQLNDASVICMHQAVL